MLKMSDIFAVPPFLIFGSRMGFCFQTTDSYFKCPNRFINHTDRMIHRLRNLRRMSLERNIYLTSASYVELIG
jgi:hypothetical protein